MVAQEAGREGFSNWFEEGDVELWMDVLEAGKWRGTNIPGANIPGGQVFWTPSEGGGHGMRATLAGPAGSWEQVLGGCLPDIGCAPPSFPGLLLHLSELA